MIELENHKNDKTALVIGVGYKACRAVSSFFFNHENSAVDFLVVDDDDLSIRNAILPASDKCYINPENGYEFEGEAFEFLDKAILKNYRIVFIFVALDDEIGCSLASIVAERFRQTNALLISVLAFPYYLNGRISEFQEQSGITTLNHHADAVFLFSNDRTSQLLTSDKTHQTHKASDELFKMPVDVILNMIALDGYINIDFKDIETVIKGPGKLAAVMSGIGAGTDRTSEILTSLYDSPYLAEADNEQIDAILLCFESGSETEFQMNEIAEVMDSLQNRFGSSPEIIWGNCTNPKLADQVRVSAIITQRQ